VPGARRSEALSENGVSSLLRLDATSGAVAIATAIGGVLRFATLDAKGFWQDEIATLAVIGGGLGDVLSSVADFERAPPVYYVVAWAWTAVFGDGEVGARSLSAVAGTAAIPIAYVAGRELVSRRIGAIAAALVAVNPFLIWYSQEARPFALLVALSALALVFFGRALRTGRQRDVALWALTSGLALATHYFAAFPFAAEAAWLLSISKLRRPAIAGTAAVGVLGAALIPLAVEQQSRFSTDDFITDLSLASRALEVPPSFLIGFEVPYPASIVFAGLAGSLAIVAVVLLLRRAGPAEHRGALICASIGVAGIGLPLLIALFGLDVFYYRNVIAALVPLIVTFAAGFGASRAQPVGLAACGVLVALLAALSVATASEDKYGRESWREAAAALGDPEGPRAIVSTPPASVFDPLGYYLEAPKVLGERAPRVAEIDVLALRRRETGEFADNPQLPEVAAPPGAPRGFDALAPQSSEDFLLFRFRSRVPRRVSVGELQQIAIGGPPSIFFQG
jgi:mannosyltransferase